MAAGASARYVAIITDGNGRWAKERGLPPVAGHQAGADTVKARLYDAGEFGIKELSVYSFSTENWSRPAEEVQGILRILAHAIENETGELHRQGARLRHIGELDALEPTLRQSVLDAIALTKDNTAITLTLAFNYGGRREIVHAAQAIIRDGLRPEEVTEEAIRERLYAPDLPEADLIIRTSGEYRMSNFLLWQGAYAEFFFSPKLWPDFGAEDLVHAVEDYSRRERRFGAIASSTSGS